MHSTTDCYLSERNSLLLSGPTRRVQRCHNEISRQERFQSYCHIYFDLFFGNCACRYLDYLTPKLTRWQLELIAWLLYDAPAPPQGIFDDFLAIPALQKNISSTSFYDFVSSLDFINPPSGASIRLVTGRVPVFASSNNAKLTHRISSSHWNEVPVTRFSAALFDEFVNQINVSTSL